MCPYCVDSSQSGVKCNMCDEFMSNSQELLTTAWSLQHSIVNETAAIARLVEIHGLSVQANDSTGVQLLQIERERQLQEHDHMVLLAEEMSLMYAVELKEIERSLLLLTEEASLYGVKVENPYAVAENVGVGPPEAVCDK